MSKYQVRLGENVTDKIVNCGAGVYWYIDKLQSKIERLNKCIDEALEIIIKDWNDKCTIPIHSVCDTGGDIRIKLYYHLFFKGVDKE